MQVAPALFELLDDGPDDGVQPGAIAAAGEQADFHRGTSLSGRGRKRSIRAAGDVARRPAPAGHRAGFGPRRPPRSPPV